MEGSWRPVVYAKKQEIGLLRVQKALDFRHRGSLTFG